MAVNFSTAKLSPRMKQLSVIALAVAVLGGVLYLSLAGSNSGPETRLNPKTDKQVNVITDQNNKNLGLEAMAGRIKYLDRSNKLLQSKIERLEKERAAEKTDAAQERAWKERFDALSNELATLRAAQKDQANQQTQKQAAHSTKKDPQQIDDPFQLREQKRKELMGDEMEAELMGKKGRGAAPRAGSRSSAAVKIGMIGESDDDSEDDVQSEQVSAKSSAPRAAYIPAGSILTGTLITGADFPTGKGSYENPTPSLIRISKHAILPNRFTSDVRECFLLVGGHGELASERAKLRGETLSCIRNDGGIIQTKLNSYVSGEDGKEGIKGRLVSKQGQLIARTMVAGFLSGMSEAFDYSQVSVLSTSASNTVQYQKNFSSEAAKGGLAKGLQNSLDRVAEFYMDLADEMVPVVEINAGRQVDVVVITGTTLNITAQADVPDMQGAAPSN
ncbi:TrbI/VirB10 family protein [Sutterella sp.]|uniref:TrbI/VirB10 family protein n=1 Tax=Sutterella sp. TaxID=1981025 RepID=UPI003FD78957